VSAEYLNQPQLAGRGTKAIVQRISELMDDGEKRPSFWPERAGLSEDVPTVGRRSIILVMPNGKQWASRSLPAAADDIVLKGKQL
jgi:hypothetical protein